ncbi:MAG TPA: HIRAN domain-containing protein [Tissierellales bacterium]|nr:HIRAN domain-containing protein [Tissierellales bacterium]
MGKLIKPDEKGIIEIIGKSNGSNLSKPFSREIFLIETHIAGTSYVSNMDTIAKNLDSGVKLNFFREPDNKYDKLAIVIKDLSGNKVGYVPRVKNEILARLMDAGKLIYGIVQNKEKIQNWYRIEVKIFLKD